MMEISTTIGIRQEQMEPSEETSIQAIAKQLGITTSELERLTREFSEPQYVWYPLHTWYASLQP